MKTVIQHVRNCTLKVDDKLVSSIDLGFLCYIGIKASDSVADMDYIIDKILNLRVIEDENDKMNLSILDTNQQVMLVSQFTLYADTKKGRRPGFSEAMPPAQAELFFAEFVERFRQKYQNVQTGQFQAYMLINYENMGPKTFIVES